MNSAAITARLADLGIGAIVRIGGRKTTLAVAALHECGATLVDAKGRELYVSDCGTHWVRYPVQTFRTMSAPRECSLVLLVAAPASVPAA